MEEIVFATAELLSIEYENGILAMEFTAPEAGEVTLQLERRPVGPYLAAGKPIEFEWDDKTLRARLPIPESMAPDHRVRIGIAMEEPEISAFFDDASKPLIIGAKNIVSDHLFFARRCGAFALTVAGGFTAAKIVRAPNEIEYEIAVPAEAADGDYANFALEVDGVALGRARLQLFRPLTVRLAECDQYPFRAARYAPCRSAGDPWNRRRARTSKWRSAITGRRFRHTNWRRAGEGLEFFPRKTEITIGATDERKLELRVFGGEGVSGLREWHLKVTGGATLDLADAGGDRTARGTVVWRPISTATDRPNGSSIAQSASGVLQPGWRTVVEFTWKDGDVNFLPEQGVFAGRAGGGAQAGDALEFIGKGWSERCGWMARL